MLQQLPVPPAVFVDRAPLIEAIGAELDAARTAGRPAYVAVHGASGVGARSLVHKVYWDSPGRFPDGAIRVRLGIGLDGGPETVREALGSVLADLGVPASELPTSIDDRHRRLLTKSNALSVLLVLEEVGTAAQVEPFLLNSPRSAVVAISRSRIRRLVQQGFRPVPVPPLDVEFGLELFERVLGPADWAPDDVRREDLVRVCGGYPLAITTTAAQIATTPTWEVADLVRQLARRGLDALDPDSQDHVRDSFDRAYQRLDPDVARAYRVVVGLHPGATVPLPAAAALLGCGPDRARSLLAVLVAAELLTQDSAERFHRHDVGHWHARDCAERDEPAADATEAVRRSVSWYLDGAVRHDRVLSARPRIGGRYATDDDGAAPTRADALAWLESHRPNLCAAVLLADRYRLDDLAWQLCEALWGVCHLHGHVDDWITTHEVGVAAAARVADGEAELRMRSQLGAARLAVGDLDAATAMFGESLRVAERLGYDPGVQSALEWLGKVEAASGRFEEAERWYAASWRAAETALPADGRPRMFALLRLHQARASSACGAHEDAVARAGAAVGFFAAIEEIDNHAKSLLVRAQALAALGRSAEAAADARPAAALFAADASLRGESAALELLLRVEPERDDRWERRLAEIYEVLGDPRSAPRR